MRRTPLLRSEPLTERLGAPVHLKLENLQETGSFKVRGAACRMLALSPEERAAGVVTCSSGNHGRAVAFVARRLGVPAAICVPAWIDPVKLDGIERAGARVVRGGATYDEAAERASALARDEGLALIHPFDDPAVVSGQGTLALEILDDLPDVGQVVAPLSGGGLCGGIAHALKVEGSSARIVAVSADHASVMLASLEAGRPVEAAEDDTLASALSGGIGLRNRWTFRLVRDLVHAHVTVGEREIARAMRYSAEALHLVVEGGGAVGLAAVLSGALDRAPASRPTVVVVSGGNVDPSVLADVLSRES